MLSENLEMVSHSGDRRHFLLLYVSVYNELQAEFVRDLSILSVFDDVTPSTCGESREKVTGTSRIQSQTGMEFTYK